MRCVKAGSVICPLLVTVALSFMVAGCASRATKEWDDIDYSKVRGRDRYENDSNYTQPTVLSCTDDDLYNCN